MNAIDNLISVLCDPEGKCCIQGSAKDREIIDEAFADLKQGSAGMETAIAADRELRRGDAGMPVKSHGVFDASGKMLACNDEPAQLNGVWSEPLVKQADAERMAPSGPTRVPLTDEQIEALPLWGHFIGLWPESRKEIARAIEAAQGIGITAAQKGGDT